MDTPQRRIFPSSPPAFLITGLAATGWGGLWVLLFPPYALPIAYVVPLAIGYWTGRRSALWISAGVFAGLTVAKASLAVGSDPFDTLGWVAATLACIAGGTAATLWLLYRAEPADEAGPAPVRPTSASRHAAVPSTVRHHRPGARQEFLEFLLESLAAHDRRAGDPVLLELAVAVIGPPAVGAALLAFAEDSAQPLLATGPGSDRLATRVTCDGAVPSRRSPHDPVAEISSEDAASLWRDGFRPGSLLRAPVDAEGKTSAALMVWSLHPDTWRSEHREAVGWVARQLGFWLEARDRLIPAPKVDGNISANAGGRRILLVEDHVDTARVLDRVLRAEGHRVTHVHEAAEALARFAVESFDLVIADLGLPDGNGADLMARLRRERPGLAGICVTGYDADAAACAAAGFSAQLTKPVEIRELHAAIARAFPEPGAKRIA